MKKIYIIPAQQVYELEVQQMLCGSIIVDGDNLGVTITPTEPGSFEDDIINARTLDLEDDFDYDFEE